MVLGGMIVTMVICLVFLGVVIVCGSSRHLRGLMVSLENIREGSVETLVAKSNLDLLALLKVEPWLTLVPSEGGGWLLGVPQSPVKVIGPLSVPKKQVLLINTASNCSQMTICGQVIWLL